MPNPAIMALLAEKGIETAQTGINTGLGLLLERHNDKRQIRQQQKLTDMQKDANAWLMGESYKHQLQMWKDTNFRAQMQELEKAGLNPGLIYGMGGGGGTTTGSGNASVSGAQAPVGGGETLQAMGMGIQLKMAQAQSDLIQAQTEKTKAETTKISRADTELAQTSIASLTQGIQNAKAQKALTEIQTELAALQQNLDENTLSDRMNEIMYRVRLLKNESSISDQTLEEKIAIIQNEAAGSFLKNALTATQTDVGQKDIKLREAQIAQTWAKIQQDWRSLDQNDTKLAIEKFRAELEKQYPGISNTLGRIIDDGINSLFKLFKTERVPHNKMK